MNYPTILNRIEIEFLMHHKILPSDLFNCNGGSVAFYKTTMKKLGKSIAFNCTPCKNRGHRLRERHNHCIMCKPSNIAFQKRNSASGFVYIAQSSSSKLLKVGFTNDCEDREYMLNYTEYGGNNDWRMLFIVHSKLAGRLENEIQSSLHPYLDESNFYYHDSTVKEAKELFNCSIQVILKEFSKYDIFFDVTLNHKNYIVSTH